MASSGNFAVLTNLTYSTTNTFSFGNCRITSSSGGWGAPLTLAASTGKYYVEVYFAVSDANGGRVSVLPTNSAKYNDGDQSASGTGDYAVEWKYDGDGNFIANNGSSSQSSVGSWAQGDVAAVAIDLDASPKTVQFYKNNSTIGTAENINTSAEGPFTVMIYAHNAGTWHINAGQDSTFGGALSAGGNADGNGFGDFKYSPPSGFNALCSANLPISSDIDPAETDNDHPQKQCGVVTYTGNAGTNAISGLGFQPDLVWIKIRNTASNGPLVDSSRGSNKVLFSQVTNSEATSANLASFDSDGFTVNNTSDYLANFNGNSNTYVAWCWRANGGTTSTNTAGTITSTVQANQAAGFSIVTYTGNDGSWGSGNQDTFGHGLSAAPEFIIVKERNATDAWTVFHHSVGAGGGTTAAHNNLRLDTNEVLYTNQSYKSFGGVMPTSTVVTVEGNTTNLSTSNHVAYCWHSVEGYSKFGQYEGNANADGAFIYTGFRPRILIIRVLNVASDGWLIYDTERETFNPLDTILKLHDHAADYSNAAYRCDILSNGFKLRSSDNAVNGTSYDPYVYMVWGDVPFKYNNSF